MTASIDGNEFDAWAGYLIKAPLRRQTYSQMGVDGVGIVFGGRDPREQIITTVTRAGAAESDATTLENTYRLLEATAVTVIDPTGREFDSTVVAQTDSRIFEDVMGWCIETTWHLIIATDNPA